MLTIKDFKTLRRACLKNAKSFLRLSNKMMGLKKWNVATFFAITSIEECQKVFLVDAYESGKLVEKDFKIYWTHHQSKIRTTKAAIIIYFNSTKNTPEEKLVFGPKSEANETMKIRENSLYVDFLQDGTIIEPSSINAAHSTQYYNQGYKELQLAISLEKYRNKLRRFIKEIKKQKIIKPRPIIY